jgi:hypothetical protein
MRDSQVWEIGGEAPSESGNPWLGRCLAVPELSCYSGL